MIKSESWLKTVLEIGQIGSWEMDLETQKIFWPVAGKDDQINLNDFIKNIDKTDRRRFFLNILNTVNGKNLNFKETVRFWVKEGKMLWLDFFATVENKKLKGVWLDATIKMTAYQYMVLHQKVSQILEKGKDIDRTVKLILETLVCDLGWDWGEFIINDKEYFYPSSKPGKVVSTFNVPISKSEDMDMEIILKSKTLRETSPKVVNFFSILSKDIAQFIKKMETINQLSHSKIQLETILENTASGVLVYDQDFKIIYANNAASNIFSYKSPKTLIGMKGLDFNSQYEAFNWEGQQLLPHEFVGRRAFLSKKPASGVMRVRLINKSKELWALVKSRPLLDRRGNTKMLISLWEDITDQITSQNQRELFLGVAGHEIKTPLMSIKAFAQLAKRNPSEYYFEKIDEQANRITKIVNEILDVTKIRSGKMELRKKTFDIDDLIVKIHHTVTSAYTSHNFILNLAARKTILGDEDRISQVISNLFINAIKYSPQSNKVVVNSKTIDGQVVVSVQDFGIGMSEEKQKYIFDSYYRIKDSPTKNIDGLGLGLYISSSIVKDHGGKIWLKSAPGKGTTFYFSLPCS